MLNFNQLCRQNFATFQTFFDFPEYTDTHRLLENQKNSNICLQLFYTTDISCDRPLILADRRGRALTWVEPTADGREGNAAPRPRGEGEGENFRVVFCTNGETEFCIDVMITISKIVRSVIHNQAYL